MKLIRILAFVIVISILNGCIPSVDDSITLSFWTDNEINEGGYKMFFVNDSYIGDFSREVEDPNCNDERLLEFIMKKSEDLALSVQNSDGESKEIGVVNLFSVSRGIKIKPNEGGKIFVNQSLDDVCTLILLSWKE